MSGPIKLDRRGFITRLESHHGQILQVYDFLEPVSPDYDRTHIETLLDDADERYRQRDHKGTLALAYEAIRHLLAPGLEEPDTVWDSDTRVSQLELLMRALSKWEKASAWLGRRHPVLPSTRTISLDIRQICHGLGDEPRAVGLNSSLAYHYMKFGDFPAAYNCIVQGRRYRPPLPPPLLRGVLGAHAGLLHKAGHYEQAVQRYRECLLHDQRYGTSPDSWGHLLGSLGYAKVQAALRNRESETRVAQGLGLMQEGLSICQDSGHQGFELAIRKNFIRFFLGQGDIDAAGAVLAAAKAVLSPYPETFDSQRATLAKLEDLIMARASGRPMRRTKVAPFYKPLNQLVGAIERELHMGNFYSTITLLTEAVEVATLLLYVKSGLATKRKFRGKRRQQFKATLSQKNEQLVKKGVYDKLTGAKIAHLKNLRDSVFHGNLESGFAKIHETPDELAECYDWLCWFIRHYGLDRYRLENSELWRDLELI